MILMITLKADLFKQLFLLIPLLGFQTMFLMI